jgi:hypothetical protein
MIWRVLFLLVYMPDFLSRFSASVRKISLPRPPSMADDSKFALLEHTSPSGVKIKSREKVTRVGLGYAIKDSCSGLSAICDPTCLLQSMHAEYWAQCPPHKVFHIHLLLIKRMYNLLQISRYGYQTSLIRRFQTKESKAPHPLQNVIVVVMEKTF